MSLWCFVGCGGRKGYSNIVTLLVSLIIAQCAAQSSLGDPLWQKATRYGCQCFCARSEYRPSKKSRFILDVDTTDFGLSITPLPMTRPTDLKYWLDIMEFIDIRVQRDRYKEVRKVFEFAPGTLIKAPPALTVGEREQLLDQLTKGKYLKLKQQMELEKKPSELKSLLQQLADSQGVDLKTAGGDDGKPEMLVIEDVTLYKSIAEKQAAWGRNCRKVCHKAAEQDVRTFWFKEHVEFAFLKHTPDPFEKGREFSDEPVHAVAMGVPGTTGSKAKKHEKWAKLVGDRFMPLLQQMASSNPTLLQCSALKQIHLQRVPAKAVKIYSWADLLKRYHTTRNPNDFYPPHRPRALARYQATDESDIELHGAVLDVRREHFSPTKPARPPKLTKYDDEMDSDAIPSIGGWLQSRNIRIAHWPEAVPQFLGQRVGGEWINSAVVQLAPPSGKLKDQAMQVTSMWQGVSDGQRVDLYGVKVLPQDAAVLMASMREILVSHWSAELVQMYKKKGMSFAAEINDDEGDYEDEGGDDEGDKSASRSRGSSRASASSKASSLLEQHARYDSPVSLHSEPLVSFLQRTANKKRDPASPLTSFEYTYVTTVWLGCWHAGVDPDQNAGALFESDNRLFLVMQAKDVVLRRADGVKFRIPLSTPPAAVGVMSLRRDGLVHMEHAVGRDFWPQLRDLRHKIARVLAEVIFPLFQGAIPNSPIFKRNTCELDTTIRDLNIAEAMPSEKHSFYVSGDPNNKDRRVVGLPPQIRQLTAELLVKCYNAVPPSAILRSRKAPGLIGQRTCADIPALARFALIETTPLQDD